MVRRRSGRRKSPAKVTVIRGKKCKCEPARKASKAAFKKCLINTIKRTKITTPKSARRAFQKASQHCRALVAGTTRRVATKGRKRKTTRRARRTSARSHERWSGGNWSGDMPRRAHRAMRWLSNQ